MKSAYREPTARNDRIDPPVPVATARSIFYSHVLTGIALLLIVQLRLLPALLAGLLVYSVINLLAANLRVPIGWWSPCCPP
jgi:hypothetical protein